MSNAKIYEAQVTKSGFPFLVVVAQSSVQDGYSEATLISPKAVNTSKPFVRIGLGTRSGDAGEILLEAVFERARQHIDTLLPEGSWLPQEIVFMPVENMNRLSARLSLDLYPAWEAALSSSHIPAVRSVVTEVRRVTVIEVGGN